MEDTNEVTAKDIAKMCNFHICTAYRRLKEIKLLKGITNRKVTLAEYKEYYKL